MTAAEARGQYGAMSKPARIPLWKIIFYGVASGLGGAVLIFLSVHVRPETTTQPSDAARSAMNLSSLLLLIGLMGVAVAGICAGWLGYRYYLSIPAWKRRKGPPKRR